MMGLDIRIKMTVERSQKVKKRRNQGGEARAGTRVKVDVRLIKNMVVKRNVVATQGVEARVGVMLEVIADTEEMKSVVLKRGGTGGMNREDKKGINKQ
jgi:hypothetical protein